MANRKVLRGNVRIVAAYPEAFADPANPTADELNNADFVHDISCAIEDDYTLDMTDPDTSDSRSICDIGQVETPTFDNYEASLDGFRDADPAAEGYYNLFFNLFKAPDIPYILIKRIGVGQREEFTVGDIISMYTVETDYPEDVVEDGSEIMLGARFRPVGGLNINHEVAA